MEIEVTAAEPAGLDADVLAVAAGGALVQEFDELFGGRLARASAEADPVAMVHVGRELPARRIAVVALEGLDPESLRTAAARLVRSHRGGGTIAWALDEWLRLDPEVKVRALVEGAVLARYDAGRWKSGDPAPRVERFVVCGAGEELPAAAGRAGLVARWTNVARELVEAPPNIATPAALAERASALPGLRTEVLDPVAIGLGALAAVGGSSTAAPRLIVLRHE